MVLLLSGALTMGCGAADGDGSAKEKAPSPVETSPVQAEDVAVVVRAVGGLEADKRVELKVPRSGRIAVLHAKEGEEVASGTPLLALDSKDLTARLRQAQAAQAEAEVKRSNAERAYERTRALRQKGIAAEQDYDDVKAELDRARAASEVARANAAFAEAELAETTVYAPFSGTLGQLRVDEGAFVREGEALGLLVDDDPLEIVFAIPERYVGQAKQGQPVEVSVTSLPSESFPGAVNFVAPEVDAESRTLTIKATIPNGARKLRAGQFATVSLALQQHPGAAVIPEAALVPTRSKTVVFVVEDDQATARTVRTGVRLPGRVEIVEGLRPGETVVVTGHERLEIDESSPVTAVRVGSEEPPAAG